MKPRRGSGGEGGQSRQLVPNVAALPRSEPRSQSSSWSGAGGCTSADGGEEAAGALPEPLHGPGAGAEPRDVRLRQERGRVNVCDCGQP